jgi:hypothetical protein
LLRLPSCRQEGWREATGWWKNHLLIIHKEVIPREFDLSHRLKEIDATTVSLL